MGGGGESKAEAYAKFGAGKYGSADFERYVDSRGDLAAAWNKIESDPTAWDSKYWIDRGATSKAAFGRAHAAEDAKLYAGTYGAGGTKVVPGSKEYDDYFGDGTGTYFDRYNRSKGRDTTSPSGDTDSDNPDPGTGTGPYPESNIYFPMLVPEYNDPKAQNWSQYMPQGQSGLLYQPWSQEYGEQFVQPNIWNYQPPELKVGRPKYYQNPLGIMNVTDYVPPSESTTTTNPNDDVENRGGTGGYGDNLDNMGNTLGLFPGDQGYLMAMALAAAREAAIVEALADAGEGGSSGLEGGGQVSGNPADKGYSGNY
jgi:hypothetical protein